MQKIGTFFLILNNLLSYQNADEINRKLQVELRQIENKMNEFLNLLIN